jgi:hypothetical protein
MGGVEIVGDGIQHLRKIGTELLQAQALGGRKILNPSKTIIPSSITDTGPVHLPGEPFPTIQINLNGKGKPGLNPGVDETEFGMNLIVVEMETLAWSLLEFEFEGLTVFENIVGEAGFHARQDANKSLLDPVPLGDVLGHVFFAGFTGREVADFPAGVLGQEQRGGFELLGHGVGMVSEVFQENLGAPQIAHHPLDKQEGTQESVEDQTIKATENSVDVSMVFL